MCRADQWLAIGLHTIQWTTEAWWQQLDTHLTGLGADWPDTVGAPAALRVGIEHRGGRVSGGLTCVNGT